MFRLRTIVVMTASALATLGCASLAPDDAPEIAIRPVSRVRHGADANALYQTGRYFQGQIRYDNAIAAYRDALAANPRHADAHNGLGVIYSVQGKPELAEQAFKAAIAAAPKAGYLHNNLGYHYLQVGRLDEALAAFERARALDPGNVRVAVRLVAVRQRLGLPADTEGATQPPAPVVEAPKIAVAPSQPSGAQAYRVETQDSRSHAWTEVPNTSAAIVIETQPQAMENTPKPAAPSAYEPAARGHLANSVQSSAPEAAPPPAVAGSGTPQQTTPTPTKAILGLATEPTAQFNVIAPNVWELRRLREPEAPSEADPLKRAGSPVQAAPSEPSRPHAESKEITDHRVEIANGNGVAGLARRIAALLKPLGIERARLTNQEPYGTMSSQIEYVARADRVAGKIKAALPGEVPLLEVRALGGPTDVRVVLGKGFPAGTQLQREKESIYRDAPGARPGDYRVEVSNGNGTTGLARRVAETLTSSGIETIRLTNRKPFGETTSRVEHVAGAEQAAEQIMAALRMELPLASVPALERGMQVKVVLGKDFPGDAQTVEARNPARTIRAARADFAF